MRKLAITFLFLAVITGHAIGKDLAINSNVYEVDTLVYKHVVGPGTKYAYYRLPERPLDIHVLEIDLNNPYINLEVVNGGQAAVACETPSHMYTRYAESGCDMVAAHNGDFYTTGVGEVGISRMGLVGAGDVIFNPTGNPLFVINEDRTPWCDFVNFNGTLTKGGSSTRIHTVNQLRLEWDASTYDNQLSLFTPAFGKLTHSSISGGAIAVIKPKIGSPTFPANKDLVFIIEKVFENPGNNEIPEDGAILYGKGSSASFLNALSPGDEVTLNLSLSMPSYSDVTSFTDAIGGSGHIILRNGEICNINNPDVHPRTFMGVSKDQKTIYSVVVDGRSGQSAGINLDDQGRLLQWLGAWDGINLDGGGSSCMVVNGKIRNHNSDGTERAVGNGVVFYSTAPADDNIAEIAFEPRAYNVPITANFRPAIYAYNKFGMLKSNDLSDVLLSCDPEIGTINSYGEFVATDKVTTGYIYAEYNGIKTSQRVNTIMSPLSLDYDKYIVNNRKAYPIQMSAPIGRFTYGVDAACVDWTINDDSVCTIENGRLLGKNNGSTTITGISPNFSGTITVTTENVGTDTKSIIDNVNSVDWSLKQIGGTDLSISSYSDGWQLDYVGNGVTRGASITISPSNNFVSFGLPHTLHMQINPGDAPIQQISMTYSDNHGGHGTFYLTKEELTANVTTDITIPLDLLFDSSDNTCFPLIISNLKFTMGTSAKSKNYKITVPVFEYVYGDISSVQSVAVDSKDALRLYPNPANAGEIVTVEASMPIHIYDIQGKCVMTSEKIIDTTKLTKGVYIVSSGASIGRLLVK